MIRATPWWLKAVVLLVLHSSVQMAFPVETVQQPSMDMTWADLRDKDSSKRNRAAERLIAYGPLARDRIPDLIQMLAGNEDAGWHAIRILESMGPCAHSAVPALIQSMNKDDEVRNHAISRALGSIGPAQKEAVPELLHIMKSNPDFYVRLYSAYSLGYMGPIAQGAVPALIEQLAAENGQERGAVVRALGEIGPSAKAAIPALIRRFEDDYAQIPQMAAHSLGKIGVSSIPALVGALESESERIRAESKRALGDMGRMHGLKRPAWQKEMATWDPEMRAVALREMGWDQPEATSEAPIPDRERENVLVPVDDQTLEAIFDTVRNGASDQARKDALWKLGSLDVEHARLVPELMKSMKEDEDIDVRATAIRVIGLMGPAAMPAVPDLLEAMNDTSIWGFGQMPIRNHAAIALTKLGEATLPALRMALENGKPHLKVPAARAILNLGIKAKDALPLVEKHSVNMPESIRLQLAATRLLIHPEDDEAFHLLMKGIRDHLPHRWKNSECCRSMGHSGAEVAYMVAWTGIAHHGERARPEFLEMLKEEDVRFRVEVIRMLQAMGSPDQATVDAIANALQHPDGYLRETAATALASFGYEARSAIPALGIAYAHKDENVRQAVRKALETLHATR